MNICMLIEAWKPLWGGGQEHVLQLCKRLSQRGHTVDLYVMNLGEGLPLKEELFDNVLLHRIGKACKFTFPSRLAWCKEVIRIQGDYDLIHAHANLPGLPAKKLSVKLGVPVVYTVHGSGLDALQDMYGWKGKLLYYVERYLHCRIKYDAQITVDSSFSRQHNVNSPIVIPNGVDISAYDKISCDKSETVKVVFVGRLHPQKGLTYLIDAVRKADIADVEFHIIGDGDEREALMEQAKGLPNIIFRGKVYGDDLIREYKSSHLFVLPSLYEGQPLTLLEAWAAKLPVLVTNVGGNKDFVTSQNGMMVGSKNEEELSRALQEMLGKDLVKMGLNGYAMVKSLYTWDKTVEKTIKVYNNVK